MWHSAGRHGLPAEKTIIINPGLCLSQAGVSLRRFPYTVFDDTSRPNYFSIGLRVFGILRPKPSSFCPHFCARSWTYCVAFSCFWISKLTSRYSFFRGEESRSFVALSNIIVFSRTTSRFCLPIADICAFRRIVGQTAIKNPRLQNGIGG